MQHNNPGRTSIWTLCGIGGGIFESNTYIDVSEVPSYVKVSVQEADTFKGIDVNVVIAYSY